MERKRRCYQQVLDSTKLRLKRCVCGEREKVEKRRSNSGRGKGRGASVIYRRPLLTARSTQSSLSLPENRMGLFLLLLVDLTIISYLCALKLLILFFFSFLLLLFSRFMFYSIWWSSIQPLARRNESAELVRNGWPRAFPGLGRREE